MALEMLAKSSVNGVYVVDSYGSCIRCRSVRSPPFIWMRWQRAENVGIHAHNNQQCAFANTVQSLAVGASMLDGTVMGMGRGAGNCSLEGLLGFLKNPV